jgi:hypothetical protein
LGIARAAFDLDYLTLNKFLKHHHKSLSIKKPCRFETYRA